jgi:hypothetical protein
MFARSHLLYFTSLTILNEAYNYEASSIPLVRTNILFDAEQRLGFPDTSLHQERPQRDEADNSG